MRNSILFLLLFSINLFSQNAELGKVTKSELEEKFCPNDSSAVAAILFEKGMTFFDYDQDDGFVLRTIIEIKIKIYKKEGFEYANKSISFYEGGSKKESVLINKAITYNLVNGVIEKTKLRSEGEFVEKINKLWSVKKVTMPNVIEGSIVEYSYTIKSPYINNLVDWDFQKKIPVNRSEYQVSTPEYFVYNSHVKGDLIPNEEKRSRQNTIILYDREVAVGLNQEKSPPQKVDFQENTVIYSLSNIKALKDEKYVDNISNYSSSISHELISVQYPNRPFKNYATSWEDVAKSIYENEDFGNQLSKNNYYEVDIKNLMQGINSKDEKINIIYSYVKDRMNWDKIYSVFCREGVKKAFEEKTGNSAEINLILVSMLRYVGIEANPVLISTRSNGVSLYPSRTAFNTVIVNVLHDGKNILLDATNKYSIPNILPTQDLNWFGRLITNDGNSHLIDLMPKVSSLDIVNGIATIENNGKISGQIRQQLYDYNAFNFRNNKSILSKEIYLDDKEKYYKNIEIDNYERENDADLSKPIIEKYKFINEGAVEIIGDKLYFSPMLHFILTENPFKQEDRSYPVDFSYPTKNKYSFNITIPEGYIIESLPSQVSYTTNNEYTSFKYQVSNSDKSIQVSVNFEINSPIIPAEHYNSLKEFFKLVIDKQNEKIVLKKT